MPSDEGKLPEAGPEHESLIADPSGKRKWSLRLRILLDTNQLFTISAYDLLNEALRKLIEESRSHRDITIEWLVPDIVRFEREYQMTVAATNFVPTLKKLERLLGHNLESPMRYFRIVCEKRLIGNFVTLDLLLFH